MDSARRPVRPIRLGMNRSDQGATGAHHRSGGLDPSVLVRGLPWAALAWIAVIDAIALALRL